jgi:hypothetical protein
MSAEIRNQRRPTKALPAPLPRLRPAGPLALPAALASACLLASAWLLGSPEPARAQIVPLKTVPVATGDQFLLFPSGNLAMGSVGLAIPDTLGDPFRSPATGSRLRESVFFSSPTFYGISNRNGSGRSLPVGALFSSGDWFSGAAFALQELKGAKRDGVWPMWWGVDRAPSFSSFSPPPNPGQDLSEASSRNLYAFGLLGRRFPNRGLSVALSASWAELGAMDGVDLLYAQSLKIEQSGHASDLRLGILKEWQDGRSLELLLLRSSLRMRHDVSYLNFVVEPVPPDTFPVPQWRTRIEENLDHTDTWGVHAAFLKPLAPGGWSLGWSFSGNRKDHPKIPNYEIQNIPRDPGDTWAWGLGVGVAKTEGPARFAADLILEPIRSHTWADLPFDTVSSMGDVIEAGDKTVENDFAFTNALIRAGGSWEHRAVSFKVGLQIRSIAYELDQFDLIQVRRRKQKESWMEWTPSAGVSFNLPGVDLHYVIRTTTGTGRPGTRWTDARMMDSGAFALAGGDIILAPSGPLTLQDARVTTHQLSVVVPMR